MPKKHTPAYTTTKPNYVHPSLQSSRASASAGPAEPQTVNQRIARLRLEQAPRATIEERNEMTSAVSSRTVPPHLRRILHIAEVDAPKPKAGIRTRTRRIPGAARPPPGPAAPTSWLQTSQHAPIEKKTPASFRRLESGAPPHFGSLASETERDFAVCVPAL
jgi:hypothetical protein